MSARKPASARRKSASASATPTDARAFIAARLPVAPVPGLPAIRLHTAAPTSGLAELIEAHDAGSPYWAYPWSGGLAIAHHLRHHPELVAGRTVLDLGAGSGLVAIAAMQAGAARAIACDTCPLAAAAIPLNAALNGVAVEPLHADLLDGPAQPVDLILVGDLFYDEAVAERVAGFLARAAGAEILVGDPFRRPLPLGRLERIASYTVQETAARAPVEAGVFAFSG